MESYQSERRHIQCKLGVSNNGQRENDVEQIKTWTWQIAATIMRHKGLMSTPSLAAVYLKWQTRYVGFINAKNSQSKHCWPTFIYFTLNSAWLSKNHVLFKCHLNKWNLPGKIFQTKKFSLQHLLSCCFLKAYREGFHKASGVQQMTI